MLCESTWPHQKGGRESESRQRGGESGEEKSGRGLMTERNKDITKAAVENKAASRVCSLFSILVKAVKVVCD